MLLLHFDLRLSRNNNCTQDHLMNTTYLTYWNRLISMNSAGAGLEETTFDGASGRHEHTMEFNWSQLPSPSLFCRYDANVRLVLTFWLSIWTILLHISRWNSCIKLHDWTVTIAADIIRNFGLRKSCHRFRCCFCWISQHCLVDWEQRMDIQMNDIVSTTYSIATYCRFKRNNIAIVWLYYRVTLSSSELNFQFFGVVLYFSVVSFSFGLNCSAVIEMKRRAILRLFVFACGE